MRRKRPGCTGTARLYRVDEFGVWDDEPCAVAPNAWMYTWGFLACKALGQRDASYALNAMYIEYKNVASTGDAVSIPSFTLADDRSYYVGLASSSDRDYLRMPIRATPEIDVAPGYEAYFAAGQGNRIVLRGQTSGDVGVNGKAFTAAAHSKVCGVALVAAPVFSDPTRDVLFSRVYYDVSKQQVRPANGDFGAGYELVFG